MKLPMLYLKGLSVNFFFKLCILPTMIVFILANSRDPDEMPPKTAFHLDLICLPKYKQNEKG